MEHVIHPSTGRACAAAFFLGAALLALPSCGPSDGGGSAQPAAAGAKGSSASKFLASLPLQVDGGTVDLGTVLPCVTSVDRVLTLRNVSKNPVHILGYASNCGCLEPTLKGDRTLQPGDARELAISLSPTGYGPKSIRVELASDAGMVGSVRIDFKVGGAVRALPPLQEHHVSAKHEAVDFEIVSEEGRAFKVLSMDPPIGEIARAEGPRALVRVSTWEAEQFAQSPMGAKSPAVKRDADGRLLQVKVTVATDDTACPQTQLVVMFTDP